MPTLNPAELFNVLVDAFRKYTEAILFVEGSNPYRFSLNGKHVSVFTGNIHRAGRSDDDEFRIQCPGDLPIRFKVRHDAGDIVVVLGFHPDWNVFSAWDPARLIARNSRAQRFSIYTRLSKIQEASSLGVSTYVDSNQQNILSFRPEFAGLYIENSRTIHEVDDTRFRRIAERYGEAQPGEGPVVLGRIKGQKITVTHTQYARSPQFSRAVLEAYSDSCAMCGVQLELIEAAHVVPHAHSQGLDVITNGIALCSLHHRSFDTSLLYVAPNYEIRVNSNRVNYLRKLNLAAGLRNYTRSLQPNLTVPSNANLRPSVQNIVLGNRVRNISI